MSRPWMPLYIADYLADTGHLSAAEHGAYLLLIMHYWQTGGLPADEGRLARIARMTDAEWAAARVTLLRFFGPGWSHERINGELAEAKRLSEAGRKGGVASVDKKRTRNPRPKASVATDNQRSVNDLPNDPSTDGERSANGLANDPSTISQRSVNDQANDLATIGQAPQPPPQPLSPDAGDARAREGAKIIGPEAFAIAAELMAVVGIDREFIPPGWCGAPLLVQGWLNQGWNSEVILIGARTVMAKRPGRPPHSAIYFEKPIAEVVAGQGRLVPVASPQTNGHHHEPPAKRSNITTAIDGLIERYGREETEEAGSGEIRQVAPRLLSNG